VSSNLPDLVLIRYISNKTEIILKSVTIIVIILYHHIHEVMIFVKFV